MQVGDLIKYSIGNRGVEPLIGIITKTPEQTNNSDYEVYFVDGDRGRCRARYMELVSASR